MSRERIQLMKKSAYLINVGRGSAVDQEALVEALNERRISGAAIDVMVPEPLPKENPLWKCQNTIITPHCSENMALCVTCDRVVDLFCRNLNHYTAGEELENVVDRKRGY